jgi:transcription elongation factor Elf1
MFDFATQQVWYKTQCPACGRGLSTGDMLFKDNDRGDVICDYCFDEYKEEVIREEGEDGRLLK